MTSLPPFGVNPRRPSGPSPRRGGFPGFHVGRVGHDEEVVPAEGRLLKALTAASSFEHASETARLEKDLPQISSMTRPTLAVETPATTIFAIVVISAASLRW